MSTFNEREKGFEKKFALDEESKFKAVARRNRKLADWAAAKLGLSGSAVDDYVKAVIRADLADKDHRDVVRKIKADMDAKGLAVDEAEIRERMSAFLQEALRQMEKEAKP